VPDYKVTITDHASKDLDVIYQHYLIRVNNQLADKLLSEIEEAIDQISIQPLLGHLPLELAFSDEDYLELLTKSFRLIYRLEKQCIIIVMILHQKQSVVKAASARLLH